ncbi:transposase [Oceanicola sp. D3]|uniref:REP-associated tyrosine transposase n=1 Tax=Oceanicola sp. D3 TaxID=2587163 RepID=UPI001123F313|nr:transposase [Oceanicola sp. D3]QDC08470.1 transposase [Oceanicola sp. D3]
MSNYRRIRQRAGTYFFTVKIAAPGSRLLTEHVDILRRAYAATHADAPFRSDAIVILPDHIHAVWTLPEGDSDYSERWRRIKGRFTHWIGQKRARSLSKEIKREAGIWQRRFWEHTIRNEEDYSRHLAYCWGNPVKHGLVERATDWKLSSIHRDIRLGRVDPEWSGRVELGDYGE